MKIPKIIIKTYVKIKMLLKKTYLYLDYLNDFRIFTKTGKTKWKDRYPILGEKNIMGFDKHYVLYFAWASRVIKKINPKEHYDISSGLSLMVVLSAFIKTTYLEYRSLPIDLDNFNNASCDLTNLHYTSNSIESLSCLHVLEHIGLGRYGDLIDPKGDIKAINELKRVASKDLLIVMPLKEKDIIQFNAHRFYSYDTIIKYFKPFKLNEFSLITDDGKLVRNATKKLADSQKYGCGCFWFKHNIAK